MNKLKILAILLVLILLPTVLFADIYGSSSSQDTEDTETTDEAEETTEGSKKTVYVPEIYDIQLLASSTSDYPVTPGDVYTLSYLVNTELVTTPIYIDASYAVKVSNLGTLNASGKTFLQFKTQVESLVSRNYPLSGVQLMLSTPGRFFVTIQGVHPNPGQKTATGLTRLSDLLYELNVADYPLSSLRDISIQSVDGKVTVYDFYKSRKSGNLANNPRLRPGDIITIARAKRFVSIKGSVYEQGVYQLMEGEGAKELVEQFASGFLPAADSGQIMLFRVETASNETVLYKKISYEQLLSEKLENGDELVVNSKREKRLLFTLEGAVNGGDSTSLQVSGRLMYKFYTGQKLSDAFNELGKNISLAADYENSYFVRDGNSSKVNIGKLLFSTDLSEDRELQDGDILVIPYKYAYVWVSGAVVSPGKYPIHPGKTSDYYIKLAGGYNRNSVIGKEKVYNSEGEKQDRSYVLDAESRIDVPSTWFMSFIDTYWTHITSIWSIITSSILIVTTIIGWFPQPEEPST